MASEPNLMQLADEIAVSLSSTICTIWVLSDQGRLKLAGATPSFAEHVGVAEYSLGEGITGTVAQTGEPVVVSNLADLHRHPAWRGKFDAAVWSNGPARRFGSLLAVPIQDGLDLLGVVKVERTKDEPAYTRKDVRVLEDWAGVVARYLRGGSTVDDELFRASRIYTARLARVEVLTTINARVMEYLRKHPDAMRTLNPLQFEHLVARLLEEDGWAVEMTLQSRDGGYDMLAVRQAGTIGVQLLVQAKKYRADRPVGVGVIRELYAVKLRHHATKALLATTSYVSAPAKAEFRGVIPWEIELKEYDDLVSWLGRKHDVSRIYGGDTPKDE